MTQQPTESPARKRKNFAQINGNCKMEKWKGRKYEDSVYRVGQRRAGRLLDGRTWDEFPKEKK